MHNFLLDLSGGNESVFILKHPMLSKQKKQDFACRRCETENLHFIKNLSSIKLMTKIIT